MKKLLTTLISLGAIFSFASCSSGSAALNNVELLRSPEALSHDYDWNTIKEEGYVAFKNKIAAFSARLSEALFASKYEENKNFVCSPVSIELCIGLAVRCADGETRQELLNLFGVDYQTFNRYYKTFYNELTREWYNHYGELEAQNLFTNSIWIDDEIDLLDEGLDALRDDYYCYSYHADFNKKNKETNEAMEYFIKDKTKGLLNPKLNLSPETLFVLMNTLYLKDIWNPYGSDLSYAPNTYKFTNMNGSVSNKQLLYNSRYIDGRTIYQDDYSSFYTKTYNGLYLYFIKPNEGKDIREVFNKENIEYVTNYDNYVLIDDDKKEVYHTNCAFPEYKADIDVDLMELFKKEFDVTTLFTMGECNFSNIINSKKVYVDGIRHIAKLDVNKKGIEGAAVTYMPVAGDAGPLEGYEYIYETFVVDKEFGFILTYQNSIMFSGVVTNID